MRARVRSRARPTIIAAADTARITQSSEAFARMRRFSSNSGPAARRGHGAWPSTRVGTFRRVGSVPGALDHVVAEAGARLAHPVRCVARHREHHALLE